MDRKELYSFYNSRKEKFAGLVKKESGRLAITAWLRLAVFVLLIFSLVYLIRSKEMILIIPFMLLIIVFIGLLSLSIKYGKRKRHFLSMLELNSREIKFLDYDYLGFDDGKEFIEKDHEFIFDLDIFGRASIFQYLNRSFSSIGKRSLARFLSRLLESKKDIYDRQSAIKDLASRHEWLQNMQAYCLQLEEDEPDNKILEDWLGDNEPVFKTRIFPLLAYILPLFSIGLIVLSIFHVTDIQNVWQFLLVPLVVVGMVFKKSQSFQRDVSASLRTLGSYSKFIEHIEAEDFNSGLLKRLKEDLYSDKLPASRIINKLSRLLDAFDTRNNMIVGLLLNALLLWDIHCLLRFDRWRQEHAGSVFTWLERLAEFDALGSLATFHFNHPGFTFPRISEDKSMEFKSLGHPLIKEERRIDNDLHLNKEKGILIVSGPNMAGKSTFLRAVGVNVVLFQAGAPVCAGSYSSVPSKLFTSMRTTDSLQENESFFFSELKRLKQLFDTVEENEDVFFLFDEILKGTNSNDKTNGSREVISRLSQFNTKGLIATHDLALSDMEAEPGAKIGNMCFDSEIKGDQLIFNYKLQDGYSKNMNATFLMKKMGIIS